MVCCKRRVELIPHMMARILEPSNSWLNLERIDLSALSLGSARGTKQRTARELVRDARALQKAVRAPAARLETQRLQGEADAALAEAEPLKLRS